MAHSVNGGEWVATATGIKRHLILLAEVALSGFGSDIAKGKGIGIGRRLKRSLVHGRDGDRCSLCFQSKSEMTEEADCCQY